jgi:hypothetical protein
MIYKDGKGIKHQMLPKFCKKYQIQVLPKGFYFEHIICVEADSRHHRIGPQVPHRSGGDVNPAFSVSDSSDQ